MPLPSHQRPATSAGRARAGPAMPPSRPRPARRALLLGAVALASVAAAAQTSVGTTPADTTRAALDLERARLTLARHELRAVTGWRRWRPRVDLFLSVSTRGVAFPSISSQGYDPAYAAIARWPGDTWGVTVSWSLDQVLDHRPAHRARAAVESATARLAQARARDVQRRADAETRRRTEARRTASSERRAVALVAQLRVEARFLDRRVAAQRELTRLAEVTYEQGETGYEALARQRLALLAAEHAQAVNALRLLHAESTGVDDPPVVAAAGRPPAGPGRPAPPPRPAPAAADR